MRASTALRTGSAGTEGDNDDGPRQDEAGTVRPRRRRRDGLFAVSRWDALLVATSVAHVGLVLAVAFGFGGLSAPAWLGLGLLSAYLTCLNYQCISHNFIHNPFFVRRTTNRCFELFNSISMGSPSSYNHVEHVIHHRYGNDLPDATGQTRDNLSIFRYGRGGQPEPLWSYALLTIPRLSMTTDYSRRAREIRQEWIVFGLFMLALAAIDLRALAWYVAFACLGMCAASAENYCEHLNGIPGDRLRDSVSVYNRLYNQLWFNNGYHQEHHFRPGVHWRDVAQLTPLLPPVDDRPCARGCHFSNVRRRVDYAEIAAKRP